jgi:transposase
VADEEALRKEAVRMRVAGQTEVEVAEELGRSVRWVRKWLARWRETPDDPDWARSRSRAPGSSPQATNEEIVEQVLAARRKLEEDPRAQRGAAAVAWQLEVMGMPADDIPQARTIQRIISRAGLAQPRRRGGTSYTPRGVPYPCPARDAGPGELHEADPVGPRWLDGGEKVHSLNVMDIGTHRVALEPIARQRPIWLAEGLIDAWGRLGLPQIVQLDNHSSLRGGIGDPRRFGPVVKAALSLGVVPRFVPLSEPWRQGAIEHFQDVFDTNFFRAERFTDLDQLRDRAGVFERFHNARHHYSTLSGATPDKATADADLDLAFPPDSFEPPDQLPETGRIEAIRFIRSDCDLDLFGEHITLPDPAEHSYVTATIDLDHHDLTVIDTDGEVLHRSHHPVH